MNKSLSDDIDKLGSCASDISCFLRQQNIQGEVGSATSCPIANWLAKSGYSNISVDDFEIVAILPNTLQEERISTPANVLRFISAFDKQVYPDLIGIYVV